MGCAFEKVGERLVSANAGTARHFRHRASGAEIVALETEEAQKVFACLFETPPDSSNGLPHVLEHMVFRGSRRFPAHSLYAALAQTSMMTGLNASTRADSTIYHFSSADECDFGNLLEVMLDALMHPLLQDDDVASERAVVLNEMIGHHGQQSNVLVGALRRELFPDGPLAYDAAGAPDAIPGLEAESVRTYCTSHYHAGNVRIFLSGRLDLAARLDQLDRLLGPVGPPVTPAEGIWRESPRKVLTPAPSGSGAGIAWALPADERVEGSLVWELLAELLLRTGSGPLTPARVGPGGRVVGRGFSASARWSSYEVAFEGLNPADVERLERRVMEALIRVVEEGFQPEHLASALDALSLRLLDPAGLRPPSLALLEQIEPGWRRGVDPLELIDVSERLEVLRRQLAAQPQILTETVRRGLLDNPHRLFVMLEKVGTETATTPSTASHRAAAAGPPPDPTARTDVPPVPALALGELPSGPPEENVRQTGHILEIGRPGVGPARLELALPLQGLAGAELATVPLLGALMAGEGPGGASVATLIWGAGDEAWLIVRGRALPKHGATLVRFLAERLAGHLPKGEELMSLLGGETARASARIADAPHLACAAGLAAFASPGAALANRLAGLGAPETFRDLGAMPAETLRATLAALGNRLRVAPGAAIAVAGMEATEAEPLLGAATTTGTTVLPPAETPGACAVSIASTNFTAGQLFLPLPSGTSMIAAHALETGWLWDAIRGHGGAYSVRCAYDPATASLSLISIRDPDPVASYARFAESPIWLRVNARSEFLQRVRVGAIGRLLRPPPPRDGALTALQRHLGGTTLERRQVEFDAVRDVTDRTMRAFADAMHAALASAPKLLLGPEAGVRELRAAGFAG